jgi:hypothetical protein
MPRITIAHSEPKPEPNYATNSATLTQGRLGANLTLSQNRPGREPGGVKKPDRLTVRDRGLAKGGPATSRRGCNTGPP